MSPLSPQISTEIAQQWRIAAPLILASLVNMGISITDVIMMGWLGTEELAAGAAASDMYSVVYYFLVGIILAVGPVLSQHLGAGRKREARRTIQQGFYLAGLAGLFGAVLVWGIGAAMGLIGVKPALIELAVPYTHMMAFCIVPMLGAMLWRTVLSAHSQTGPFLVATAATLPINALGNYLLMFGHWGLAPMGLAGAGLSSALAAWVLFFSLCFYSGRAPYLRRYRLLLGLARMEPKRWGELVKVGMPMGLQNLIEFGVYLLSTVVVAVMGAQVLAAHAVALRMAGVIYAVPAGLGQAALVRVGYALGASDGAAVRRTTATAMSMALAVGCVYLVMVWGFHRDITAVFLDPATTAETVFVQAGLFLTLLALSQPLDCLSSVAAGVLRGFKDTRVPMMISAVGFWSFGALGLLLAFPLQMGALGIWIGLIGATVVVGACYIWRARRAVVDYSSAISRR